MKLDLSSLKKANLALNHRERTEGRTVLDSLPVSLYADLNLKCNLKCPSCFRMDPALADTKWPAMDFELFEKLAHALFPTAYRAILSGGGESLLNRRFDDMLELCLEYGVRPTLYSNATTLTPARIERIFETGTILSISIDGARKESFEELRFPAKWEVLIRALECLQETRARIADEESLCCFNVVIQRGNADELPEFVDLAHRYGVEVINFSKLIPFFETLKAEEVGDDEIAELLIPTMQHANEIGVRVLLQDYSGARAAERLIPLVRENARRYEGLRRDRMARHVKYPDTTRECGIPWSELLIQPDGVVSVGCCNGLRMGDLREQSFEEVWNGEPYQRLRANVNTDEPEPSCGDETCPFRR